MPVIFNYGLKHSASSPLTATLERGCERIWEEGPEEKEEEEEEDGGSWCSDQVDGEFEAFSGEEDEGEANNMAQDTHSETEEEALELDGQNLGYDGSNHLSVSTLERKASEKRVEFMLPGSREASSDREEGGQLTRIFGEGGLLEELRSDESGRLTFLRAKTFDRLREKTWNYRRSSSERDLTPTADNEPQLPSTATTPTTTTMSNVVLTSPDAGGAATTATNRLSRIFSVRRSGELTSPAGCPPDLPGMHPLREEEEAVLGGGADGGGSPAVPPPVLAPAPPLMSPEQAKRRCIVNSLVQSENNYLDSLQRLLQDYKQPLVDSRPPILSETKVATIFYRVAEILQCHSIFRIALSEAVRKWDQEEKIGDVFVASFSKSVVLEVYSDFINNFTEAMEVAKTESKRKSAFADFLKVKQITAHDRLNFYGLIVKPIQRFPQFILLLQDLLKETPPGHADRMALQLALTTLESLAEMLNERKRESEQIAAFRAKIRLLGGKLGGTGRVLLREDDVTRLEFNAAGQVCRSKPRRLLLLNDRVVCVAASGRPSEVEMMGGTSGASSGGSGQGEKLCLKWVAGIEELDVIEGAGAGTLARLTTAGTVNHATTKKASLGKPAASNVDKLIAENLAQDMADLMHDFDVVSRMNTMLGSLKCEYPGLSAHMMNSILDGIQASIRQKDDEMSWLDKSCLQLVVRRKDKTDTLTFQMRSPSVKQDWVVELRLARLALDRNNAPGWDVLEQARFTGRLPLYVKHMPVHHSDTHQTEVVCGTSYTLLVPTPTRTLRPVTYVWVNATDGLSSQLKVFQVLVNQQISLKELATHTLSSCTARGLVFVPGGSGGLVSSSGMAAAAGSSGWDNPLASDLVWVATDDRRVLLYGAAEPERGREVGRIVLASEAATILYHAGQVWVGLGCGSLSVYRRDPRISWDLECPQTQTLGQEPVSALLPVPGGLYAACGRKVSLIDTDSFTLLRQFTVNSDTPVPFKGSVLALNSLAGPGSVCHMAVAGVGLWVAMLHSSTIALYHTESFIHLQDINIASNVSRVLAARDVNAKGRSIFVTALAAAKGLLWVGTNVGIALTIPLPRLEGVPIISGKANISYHAHFGPVRMFLPIVAKVCKMEPASYRHQHQTIPEEPSSPVSLLENHLRPVLEKQISESGVSIISNTTPGSGSNRNYGKQFSSPVLGSSVLRKSHHRESILSLGRKASKTLPRGFVLGPTGSESSGDSVFGLYGDLMNVENYECDSSSSSSHHQERTSRDGHRSDPELDTIQYRVSTLDRRVTMKSQRPRSLDLSSWSVESRGSNHTTSSSETGSEKTSPSVSRTASFASSDRSNPSDNSSWTNSLSRTDRTLTREQQQPSAPTTPTVAPTVSSSTAKEKAENLQRTVTTLMGGRGYIQWRASHVERNEAAMPEINNCDAYLVIWDHKL